MGCCGGGKCLAKPGEAKCDACKKRDRLRAGASSFGSMGFSSKVGITKAPARYYKTGSLGGTVRPAAARTPENCSQEPRPAAGNVEKVGPAAVQRPGAAGPPKTGPAAVGPRPAAADPTTLDAGTDALPGKLPEKPPTAGQTATSIIDRLADLGQDIVNAYYTNEYRQAVLRAQTEENRQLTTEEQLAIARLVAARNAVDAANDQEKYTPPNQVQQAGVTGEKSWTDSPAAVGGAVIVGAVVIGGIIYFVVQKPKRGRR